MLNVKKIDRPKYLIRIASIFNITLNNWNTRYLLKKDFAYSKVVFSSNNEKRLFHILRKMLQYDKTMLRYDRISTMRDFSSFVQENGEALFVEEFMKIYNRLLDNDIKLFDII